MPHARRFAVLLALSACWAAGATRAQEIEPRSYSPAPTGVNFLVAVAGNSEGGVLTDPSLPVTNIEAKIDALALGYGRTYGLFGRSANFAVVLPYVRAHATGDIGETRAVATREGLGDTRLRFGVNLLGGPALNPREYAQNKPGTTLGFSLTVNVPTGEYMPDKLVNIGTHRWAVKPEFGLVHPVGKWYLEAYVGAWLFGDNDDFFGGHHRQQDPLGSIQAHVSYTFKPRMWAALDATYYEGGRTKVDGAINRDRQENTRAGLTFAMPVGQKYSLKFNWSRGASTRIGSNFTTVGVGLQYTWMDKPRGT
ncbi:MAG TPA: transporter [Steroidobacteraceae bacterium]|nr:transporter [Steroidobacteraceae bacterium]